MRCVLFVCASVAALCATPFAAHATVAVAIDLSHQKMHVESSSGTFDWPISSARSGFYTPGGSFAPTHLEAMHYSHKYHMSPMPHAIFFRGGYAIHGTYATGSLGRPASHGCVRLSPANAAHLYDMVKAEGARISISGSPPQGATRIATAHRRGLPVRDGADPTFAARFESGDGDVDRPQPRHRRVRAGDPALEGYRYVGQQGGHRVFQALPSPSYGEPPLFGGSSLF